VENKINFFARTGRLKACLFFFIKLFPAVLFVFVAMKKDTKKLGIFCIIDFIIKAILKNNFNILGRS